MANQPEYSSATVSRRSILLRGAACATGVATILVANTNYCKGKSFAKNSGQLSRQTKRRSSVQRLQSVCATERLQERRWGY